MKHTFQTAAILGKYLIAGFILSTTLAVQARSVTSSVNFSYKDWDLTCDNTLTCRAAGYSADDSDPAATVLLTRVAGPGTPVDNKVMLADYDADTAAKNPGVPHMLIADHSLGKLMSVDGDSWQMNPVQFAALLKALRHDSKIVFKDSVNEYIFSSAGSSAVLLKMDDVQGRVGTQGALIKKGPKDESAVKNPVPAPVIIKAPVTDKESRDMTPPEMALIKPALMKLIGHADNNCSKERLADTWQIAGLNQTQSLVMVPCWMGAYNDGYMYFVISNDMATPPEMITDSASFYDDGAISFSMKDRGLGDCWSNKEWVWDGKHFIQSSVSNTGRCRLIRAGGAWNMISLTTKIKSQ
ncbi:DUF1176 domain-containing protein [Yersinia pseudotuberculosis]|uniref:DUF1176 domain-containing protein n=1 Tax=Yersinia pseudotuberculosis TaxID=633 RepID=UPI0005E47BEC|nr:DUF1176 domain-containing protein [Yersinia pseudotuberculosis]CND44737.1 Protein of uncharacterised function (DUF1176) [Yersinia pseudotuberculosis]